MAVDENEVSKSEKFTMGDLMDPDHPRRAEMVDRVSKFFESNKELQKKIADAANAIADFSSVFIPKALKAFSDVSNAVKRASEIQQKNHSIIIKRLNFLAENNWFISFDIDLYGFEEQVLSMDGEAVYEEDPSKLDDKLVCFYKEYEQYLASAILSKFPKREFAIRPAIDAHLRGEYALSIPVFLSQADGIVLDITQQELFTSIGHVSIMAKQKISKNPNAENWMMLLDETVWTQLSSERPIGWSKKKRGSQQYSGFNRNTILHGLDLHYATEQNSYKAFSLLAHVASLDFAFE